jgi:hypothetical protein
MGLLISSQSVCGRFSSEMEGFFLGLDLHGMTARLSGHGWK